MFLPFIRRIIILAVTCQLLSNGVFAQQPLKGRVLSADTHQPLVAANVFLANTSIGVITNEKGEFNITRFPAGRYDLVISSIGYETVKRSIQSNDLPALLQIILKPKVEELQEVIVEAYDKDGWDKWGKVFMDNFIGTSSFSQDCQLLNHEAINFRYSKNRHTVRATANELLVIQNKALGYLIKYDLIKFEYDLMDRSFIYQGYPFFEEMQSDKQNVLKRWKKNRDEAYEGSIMHFMRAVFDKRLAEEKFEVRRTVKLTAEEKDRVEQVYKKLPSVKALPSQVIVTDANGGKEIMVLKNNGGFEDSLYYYKQARERPVGSYIVFKHVLSEDSISNAIDDNTCELAPSTTLNVIYLPKKNLPAFQKYLPRFSNNMFVASEMTPVNGNSVYILANGSYFEGTDLIFSGFWAWWGKICNKLPYDFTQQK